MRAALAEVFGTFTLVFAGTGAIVINQQHPGSIGHVGIALTFGLVVLAMIYALGDISDAHLNPAVSLGLVLAGQFSWRQLPIYWFAQAGGAFAASGLLRALFPENLSLGTTLPQGPPQPSLILEVILTMILMVVILVAATSLNLRAFTGVAVGATIGLEALFAGPVCGASMNPFRSLAPAVVSGQYQDVEIYLLAPTLGAILGVGLWYGLKKPSSN